MAFLVGGGQEGSGERRVLSIPATARRSPCEHHWTTTSTAQVTGEKETMVSYTKFLEKYLTDSQRDKGTSYRGTRSCIHDKTPTHLSDQCGWGPERGHHSCSSGWCLQRWSWLSAVVSGYALRRCKGQNQHFRLWDSNTMRWETVWSMW